MRDVTDVMVRLHIGCDALVRGRARCNVTSRIGAGATSFEDDVRSSRDGDATSRRRRRQLGSVALRSRRVHPVDACPLRHGFALWVHAGFDVAANFGKWQ